MYLSSFSLSLLCICLSQNSQKLTVNPAPKTNYDSLLMPNSKKKKKEVTHFLKIKTIQKTRYLAVMKNNDVYMQTWKHSLNKLLRKKTDDKYYKKWLKVYQKFNFSGSVIFIFDYLPMLSDYKRVRLLMLQRPISHFNSFDNQCAVWWGLGKRGRQFYSVWVEGEISTIFLESKMAFKRHILIKLIIYLLRLI